MNDELASSFRDVDRAGDFALFSGCLDLVASLPFFAAVKRASFGHLDASPGRRILDVGCGLGDDAAALAGQGASVVGIDASSSMIDAARTRHGDIAGLSFEIADAASLPFDAASFDACRIDRVLQHIPDPAAVVREMARVLRPGGVLVAYDNDWETLAIHPGDRPITRTILNAWCDRFPSGWIGRQLPGLLRDAGLVDVEPDPHTLVIRDLDLADRLYALSATAARLSAAGTIGNSDAGRWSSHLRDADAAGRFFSALTGFLVRGTRPPK